MNFRKKRVRLYLESDMCFYCKKRLTLEESTLDHFVPQSKGGTNDISNLVIACVDCNQAKKDKTWFRALLNWPKHF